MPKRHEALITPEVVLWARKRVNMPLEVAARKLQVDPETLEAWEQGTQRPSMSKARDLARVYRRPLAIFYLPEPPEPLDMLHDFRRLPGADVAEPSFELLFEIERAEHQRTLALQLLPPDHRDFPYLDSISLSENPEDSAVKARQWLGVAPEEQFEWKGSKSEAFRRWKNAVEQLGVLVLQTAPYIGHAFPLEEARGFSIGESTLPVIVINAKDQYGGRIFTLLHEFAHLLLNVTGICNLREVRNAQTEDQRIEKYCNHIAGAILVPADILFAQPIVQQHATAEQWSEDEIANLARTFAVSEEVLVRRLAILNLTTDAFYRQKREDYKTFYADQSAMARKGGFAPPEYMVLRKNGLSFTRMVLEAYYQDRITLSKVADYLGINLKLIDKVEKAAFAGLTYD